MSRSVRVAHQQMENNVKNQRRMDDQRREVLSYMEDNAKMTSVARMQSNADVRSRQSNLRSCESEKQYIKLLEDERSCRRLNERTNYQNEAIATELSRMTIDNERRSKEMQKICEESDELRFLERTLKSAYLNKDRAAQLEYRMQLTAIEQSKMHEIEDRMEFDRQLALAGEANQNGVRREKFLELRICLQDQMREKEEREEDRRRGLLAERNVVDEIVDRINQEDEDYYRGRKESQAMNANMILEAEQQRRQQVSAAREAAQAEDDRIAAYNRSVAARTEGHAARRQAKLDDEARTLKRISEIVAIKQREEEEFEELKSMLYEEEAEIRRQQEQDERRNRQLVMKRDMIEANADLLSSRAERRQIEMENEARIVSAMRKKFAEDEAQEKAEEERRIRKKLEQLSYLENQKMEKKHLNDEERERVLKSITEENRREEYKRRVVAEARRRLLDEHAAKLQGYLPGKLFNGTEEHDRYQPHPSRQPHRVRDRDKYRYSDR